nr:phage tail protein [uncultured Butyricicoccus sp.]
MKDMVPKGTGNSRFLRSSIAADITHEELVALLRSGKFPVDFAGLNSAGIQVQGSAYNKANVLPDNLCSILGISTDSEPKDAFLKVSSDRGLKIGDSILSENTLPSNFLPCDGRYIDKNTYSQLSSIIGTKYGFFRTKKSTTKVQHGSSSNNTCKIVCSSAGDYMVASYTYSGDASPLICKLLFGSKIGSSPIKTLNIGTLGVNQNPTFDCAFLADGDVVIAAHNRFGTDIKLAVYSTDGTQKAFSTFQLSGMTRPMIGMTSDIIGTTWLIAQDRSGKKTYYYEITNTLTPKLVDTQTLYHSLQGNGYQTYKLSRFMIGKVGAYYFLGNKRGTSLSSLSTYSIDGKSSTYVYDIKQDSSGVLYVLLYTADLVFTWYKTTDGTTFTKVASGKNYNEHPSPLAPGIFLSDGIHMFNFTGTNQSNPMKEHWYKESSPYLGQNIGYLTQSCIDVSSKLLTNSGFVVPYFAKLNDSSLVTNASELELGLFSDDYKIKMPIYEIDGTYMQMKVKT